jgi:hypothetical protein
MALAKTLPTQYGVDTTYTKILSFDFKIRCTESGVEKTIIPQLGHYPSSVEAEANATPLSTSKIVLGDVAGSDGPFPFTAAQLLAIEDLLEEAIIANVAGWNDAVQV